MKFQYIFLLILSFVTSCKQTSKKEVITEKLSSLKEQPNILIILIDDAGYADFGFMGSEDLETPNIDKLAKSGVIFTDAHVTSTVCAPSRAGLMTGKYQQRFGFEANNTGYGDSGDIGLSDEVVTMADVFKANGYHTYALGKWHLGGHKSDHPNQRGFDEFFGFESGSRSYFPLLNPSKSKMLQHNGNRIKFEGYMTDVLTDQAVNYIQESKEHPFFMYLAYNAVHTPMQAKEEHLEKFKNHPKQKLAAMTWSLDENIGKIQQKLETLNIANNTLIYFLSDNGGAANNSSSNLPLKGWKGNKFEGGHRVPFIVSWPGEVKGNRTFNGLSSSLDIFTTSISAAQIRISEKLKLDGVNLLPYLKSEKIGNPHDKLFWRKLEESGARVGDYKLIRLQDYGYSLYNLRDDLGETKNLVKINSPKFDEILIELESWEKEIIKPLWVEDRNWMDVTYHIHERLMENKKVLYKNPSEMKKVKEENN
ncbi:sulfatase [Flavicella sp.]|uniref:sulfatase n=1 Tax=Flavicella sp. TaxID=2957742 RepID=UPI00301AD058